MPSTSRLILILVLLLAGGAGAYWFVTKRGGEQPPRNGDAASGATASGTREPESSGAASAKAKGEAVKCVILLTVDTLRTDALPIYGNPVIKTPALTKLASESVVFDNATATSPWTRPTAVSIITGLPPAIHGTSDRNIDVEAVLPDSIKTLPEYMKNAGYKTVAFGYNPFISASPNLRRGFDVYDVFPRDHKQPGARIKDTDPEMNIDLTTQLLTEMAIDWIDKNAGEKFFMWLHYYDPHSPYLPRKRFYETFSKVPLPDDERQFFKKSMQLNQTAEQFLRYERAALQGKNSPTDQKRYVEVGKRLGKVMRFLRDLYLAEVCQVDEGIGRVLAKLREKRLYDETLLLLTSDHGEEFGEHGRIEHGHTLHRELLRVPLVVKLPNRTQSHRIKERVTVLNVMPTILELCNLATLNSKIYERSLAQVCLSGKEPEAMPYLIADSTMYGQPQVSVITGNRKYIRRNNTMQEAVFDHETDPWEKRNLAEKDEAQETLAKSREILEKYEEWAAWLKERLWGGKITLTESSEERLKLLRKHGYLK